MAKFKIGDKVKILDGSEIKDYTGSWASGMKKYVGNACKISSVDEEWGNGRVSYQLVKGGSYDWDERGLELVEEENEDGEEKKIEVDEKSNKKHFIDVAAEVASSKFCNLLQKDPSLIVLFAFYARALADELFDE